MIQQILQEPSAALSKEHKPKQKKEKTNMSMKTMTYNDDCPKGKDVSSTNMLSTTAKERHATGTNSTKEYTNRKPSFGKLGIRGHVGGK